MDNIECVRPSDAAGKVPYRVYPSPLIHQTGLERI